MPTWSELPQDVEVYIASLKGETLPSYAGQLWRYLSGASSVFPESLLFGLAPIESRAVDEILGKFADKHTAQTSTRPSDFR